MGPINLRLLQLLQLSRRVERSQSSEEIEWVRSIQLLQAFSLHSHYIYNYVYGRGYEGVYTDFHNFRVLAFDPRQRYGSWSLHEYHWSVRTGSTYQYN